MIDRFKKLFSNSKVLSQSSVYFVGNAIISIANFILVPIYSRLLLPKEFAKIALIMIFFQVAKAIIKLGLEPAFSIKFYKSNHSERINNMYNSFIMYFLAIFIFIIITIVNIDWISIILNIELTNYESITITIFIIGSIFVEFYFNLLKIEQKPKLFVINTVIFSILKILLLIYFIVFLKQGYSSYLNANLLIYLIFSIIAWIYFLKEYNFKMFSFDKNIIGDLIKIGIPMVPGIILSLILASGDQYILKRYDFLTIVGIYAMGYKFANAFSKFLIVPFRQALVPIAMEKGNKNIDEYKKFLSKVCENFVSILLFCVIILYSFFHQLYNFIVEESYSEGFNIIWIIIISLIIWGAANILSNTIILKEQTHKKLILTIIATVSNIGLNILLIPKYDMYGAAYATLISYTIVSILYYFLSQKLIKINYNYKKIMGSIIIFVGALNLELLIDKMNYNFLFLIIAKLFIVLITGFLYFKFRIIDFSILRGES
jgi:O-antigen/teichoic acid export membrane protein